MFHLTHSGVTLSANLSTVKRNSRTSSSWLVSIFSIFNLHFLGRMASHIIN